MILEAVYGLNSPLLAVLLGNEVPRPAQPRDGQWGF
jgi:hypothetical protein